MQKRVLQTLVGALFLTVISGLPSHAAPPGLATRVDIGGPAAKGSLTGPDASGVMKISGSGSDIWGQSDQFFFAYDPVKGDSTITSRFLKMDQVGHAEWTKIGLMIRESDAADSAMAFLDMTSGHGMQFEVREAAGASAKFSSNVTHSFKTDGPGEAWMRLQRVGNSIDYYHSQDGKTWYVAAPTQTIPTLKEEALVGLAATAVSDGDLATASFDKVEIQPGPVLVSGVQGCGADKAAILQWQPVPGATSYKLYRAPADATDASQFKPVTDKVVVGTSYTDASDGLANGTPVQYAIAAVTKATDGTEAEGDRVVVSVTPDSFNATASPPGYTSVSVKEVFPCGVGAQFDPATNTITVRGSGNDIWNQQDEFNFTQ